MGGRDSIYSVAFAKSRRQYQKPAGASCSTEAAVKLAWALVVAGTSRAPIRSTPRASISTEADRPNISTEITNRKAFLLRTRIPSRPARGPDLTLTRSPHFMNGWGSTDVDLSIRRRTASISSAGIAAGPLANPTTVHNPGVATI